MGLPGDELTLTAWLWLAAAAALVGVAKTAVNGVASIAVVIFAAVLPARESTGAILPLLLCGDVVAVAWYRRHADWGTMWRLLPGVLPGLVVGAWFVAVVDDTLMRRTIAGILLIMCAVQSWHLAHNDRDTSTRSPRHPHGPLTVSTGAAAGFATMTANAAGPITTIYLIRAGLPMMRMIGTGAWFYLLVNLAKVPFSAGLGLITPASLVRDAMLLPALLVGAGSGILLVRRLRRRQFEVIALAFSAGTAILLLL